MASPCSPLAKSRPSRHVLETTFAPLKMRPWPLCRGVSPGCFRGTKCGSKKINLEAPPHLFPRIFLSEIPTFLSEHRAKVGFWSQNTLLTSAGKVPANESMLRCGGTFPKIASHPPANPPSEEILDTATSRSYPNLFDCALLLWN